MKKKDIESKIPACVGWYSEDAVCKKCLYAKHCFILVELSSGQTVKRLREAKAKYPHEYLETLVRFRFGDESTLEHALREHTDVYQGSPDHTIPDHTIKSWRLAKAFAQHLGVLLKKEVLYKRPLRVGKKHSGKIWLRNLPGKDHVRSSISLLSEKKNGEWLVRIQHYRNRSGFHMVVNCGKYALKEQMACPPPCGTEVRMCKADRPALSVKPVTEENYMQVVEWLAKLHHKGFTDTKKV